MRLGKRCVSGLLDRQARWESCVTKGVPIETHALPPPILPYLRENVKTEYVWSISIRRACNTTKASSWGEREEIFLLKSRLDWLVGNRSLVVCQPISGNLRIEMPFPVLPRGPRGHKMNGRPSGIAPTIFWFVLFCCFVGRTAVRSVVKKMILPPPHHGGIRMTMKGNGGEHQ